MPTTCSDEPYVGQHFDVRRGEEVMQGTVMDIPNEDSIGVLEQNGCQEIVSMREFLDCVAGVQSPNPKKQISSMRVSDPRKCYSTASDSSTCRIADATSVA